MSFDIIVLKPTYLAATDLSEIDDILPIGSSNFVTQLFNSVFPGCWNEGFKSPEGFAVEATLNGEPVSSVHLTLRYGSTWSSTCETQFISVLSGLCRSIESLAFAVSDNSLLAPHA